MLRVFIPRYQQVESTAAAAADQQATTSTTTGTQTNGGSGSGKSYFVYVIEVSTLGKFSRVERRYSQFLSLHHELKKSFKSTPEFPPKKLRNSTHKVLEQRRRGLESYLQHFVRMESPSQAVLDFLEVPRESLNVLVTEKPTHQPICGFAADPFLNPAQSDRLPDIVAQATLDFFFN